MPGNDLRCTRFSTSDSQSCRSKFLTLKGWRSQPGIRIHGAAAADSDREAAGLPPAYMLPERPDWATIDGDVGAWLSVLVGQYNLDRNALQSIFRLCQSWPEGKMEAFGVLKEVASDGRTQGLLSFYNGSIRKRTRSGQRDVRGFEGFVDRRLSDFCIVALGEVHSRE
jgi:hypothetical protein